MAEKISVLILLFESGTLFVRTIELKLDFRKSTVSKQIVGKTSIETMEIFRVSGEGTAFYIS